ncbi:MAG TPA: DNA recombination protein RmuC [Chitinophagaceae bacterium]|nr:DNA recombination protein RmuC [Chitinophagaceae bacterium]
MEIIVYIAIGIIIGTVVGWLLAKAKTASAIQTEKDAAQLKYSELEKELVGYKATTTSQLNTATDNLTAKSKEIGDLKLTIEANAKEIAVLNSQVSIASADLRAANNTILDKNATIEGITEELKAAKKELSETNHALATAKATNEALKEKLQTQKDEIEALGKKFNTEFENIANKILETKTEKFTELNKTNLKTILEPLGENIKEFKTKVEEVYDKESKERFSLGEKVKELAQLNKAISEEAHNLTKALKGEAKTQGRWGEMILESILEKSGLVKDREYFMEHELLDSNGNPLKSDSEGKKMRPDAVIKYPDNRSVIIDSKVSLNAFTRLIASADAEEQKRELAAHVSAVKSHIVALNAKGYDDYDKALDFVMMFVPSEPAYIAALQGDPDLWNFAYDKRILLLSPTNLITSLKLIVDLWKREYQNQNALEIAERGAKLYDKFVGFVANLEDVGEHLDKAQGKYSEAYKQLSTGNDNLVLQATKLKALGLKTKKELPKEILNAALGYELIKQIVE